MTGQPTLISLLGAGVYFGVAMSCLWASITARRLGQRNAYSIAWLIVGAVFVLLVVSRVFGIEDQAEILIRRWMIAQGDYTQRGDIQRPIAAIVVALGAGAAVLFGYLARRHVSGRREVAVALALAGMLAMVALVVIRLVSLHAIDRWLYGPLKLNWLADIGLSALVAGCAVYFVLVVTGRISRRD